MRSRLDRLRGIRSEWPLLLVLAAFAASACIVPTLSNIATTDDWGYSRSVEILVHDGKLMVFSVVAATAVGQVLWGALFALVFGMSLGVMRLSTVVMVALGAIALYAILRQLGVSRNRSAIGVAVHLFNPLSFMLAFTFMTDPHFMSVMLIAVAFYIRGLDAEQGDWRIVVLASFFAGWAFLIRQQGALIPLAVGCHLLATRQVWFFRQSARRLLAVGGLTAAMLIGYYLSLRWILPIAIIQTSFLDEAKSYGWSGTWHQLRHLTYIEMAYLGALVLPVTLALLPWTWPFLRQLRRSTRWAWLGIATWLAGLGIGAWVFTWGEKPRRMPYISQFAGLRGLGPADVRGARLRLVELDWIPDLLTILSVGSAAILGIVICRRIGMAGDRPRCAAAIVGWVAFWQFIGVLPPSYHYVERGGSLDRYLLPLFPLAIALLLWALRDVRLMTPVAWVAVAALAAFSTAGARDYLVYIGAVWDMGHYANGLGVANTQIDAGSAWDGYHVYTNGQEKKGTKVWSPEPAPWWIYLYARRIDSTYIVSTNPTQHPGYVVIEHREYSQWLEDDPVYVYLLRKWGG
jgi:hypothetical protein